MQTEEQRMMNVAREYLDAAARNYGNAKRSDAEMKRLLRAATIAAHEDGLSKSEVARRAGVTRRTIDAWLVG